MSMGTEASPVTPAEGAASRSGESSPPSVVPASVASVTALRSSETPDRVGHCVMDDTSTILRVDDDFCAITGFGMLELVGRRGLELIHPDDRDFAMEAWMMMLERPGRQRPMRLRHRTAADGWLWVESVNHLGPDGSVRGEIVNVLQRPERTERATPVGLGDRVLRQLGQALPLGVMQLDGGGSVTYSNQRLAELLENHHVETLVELLQLVVEEDRAPLTRAVTASFMSGTDGDVEIRIDPRIGCHRICSVSVRPVTDEHGSVAATICCLTDITEQVTQRNELRRRNQTDPLTGALNRRAAVDALQEMLDERERAAVVFVDIDNFAQFNERHGHAVGDDLLVEVARRLDKVVCELDHVGRYGGDEFIIVANCDSAVDSPDEIGRRISQVLHRPVTLPSGCFDLTASIGVASTSGSVAGAERLIARAGSAMYEAKEQPNESHVVWRDPVRTKGR